MIYRFIGIYSYVSDNVKKQGTVYTFHSYVGKYMNGIDTAQLCIIIMMAFDNMASEKMLLASLPLKEHIRDIFYTF